MYLQVNKKLQPRKSTRSRLSKMGGFATKNKKVWLFAGITILGAATIIGLVAGLSMNAITADNSPNSGGGMVEQPNQNGTPNQQPGTGNGPNNGGDVLPPPNMDNSGNNNNNGGLLPETPNGDGPNMQPEMPPSQPEGEQNQPGQPDGSLPQNPGGDQQDSQPDQNLPPEMPPAEQPEGNLPDNEHNGQVAPTPPPAPIPTKVATYHTGPSPDEFLIHIPLNQTVYNRYRIFLSDNHETYLFKHKKLQEYVEAVLLYHLKLETLFTELATGQTPFSKLFKFGREYQGVQFTYKTASYRNSDLTLEIKPQSGYAWDLKTEDTTPKTIKVYTTIVIVPEQFDVPGFSVNDPNPPLPPAQQPSQPQQPNNPPSTQPPSQKPPVNQQPQQPAQPTFKFQSKRHLEGPNGQNRETLVLTWNWDYVQKFRFFLQLYNGPQASFLGNRHKAFDEFLQNTVHIEGLIQSLSPNNPNPSPRGRFQFRDQYQNVHFIYVRNSAHLDNMTFKVVVQPIPEAGWANETFGKGNQAIAYTVKLAGLS